MSDQEKRLITAINRADKARQAIENEVFKEAFVIIRADLIDKLNKVDVTNTEEVRILTIRLQEAEKFQNTLFRVMESGKLAQSRLEKITNKLKGN